MSPPSSSPGTKQTSSAARSTGSRSPRSSGEWSSTTSRPLLPPALGRDPMSEKAPGRVLRPLVAAFAAPLVYAVASFLTFGLPVAAHPRSTIVGDATDPGLSVWSFAWWPHALRHGLNPFYPHLVWAPGGTNLSWAGSIPAISLIFSPLTALAGPEVSYNVASTLAPALAAWCAFLLCRYLTGRFW